MTPHVRQDTRYRDRVRDIYTEPQPCHLSGRALDYPTWHLRCVAPCLALALPWNRKRTYTRILLHTDGRADDMTPDSPAHCTSTTLGSTDGDLGGCLEVAVWPVAVAHPAHAYMMRMRLRSGQRVTESARGGRRTMRMRRKRPSSRSEGCCAPSKKALPPPSWLWRGGCPPLSSMTALGCAHRVGTAESGCHRSAAHRTRVLLARASRTCRSCQLGVPCRLQATLFTRAADEPGRVQESHENAEGKVSG